MARTADQRQVFESANGCKALSDQGDGASSSIPPTSANPRLNLFVCTQKGVRKLHIHGRDGRQWGGSSRLTTPENRYMNPYLPPLTAEEFAALKADIKTNGILVPILEDEHGQVIDGFHRRKIAVELRIKDVPTKIVAGLSDEEKRHMAYRLNANRRQLSQAQKRELVAAELKRSPDLSNAWIASLLGVGDKLVEAVRREMEGASTIPLIETYRCKDGKRRKYRSITVESKKDEARASAALQALPPDAPSKPLSLDRAEMLVRKAEIKSLREKTVVLPTPDEAVQVYCKDFRELEIEPGSAKLIFTDPPYEPSALPLWEALAERAATWLKPGGVLMTYSGVTNIPDILNTLGKFLRYWWTVSLVHSQNTTVFAKYNVQMCWRPAFIFTKGDYTPLTTLRDCIRGTPSNTSLHPYEQSEFEARMYIEALTTPGDLVIDPFLGSGTTAVACQHLGRRFVGCDIDPAWVVTTQERLGRQEAVVGAA